MLFVSVVVKILILMNTMSVLFLLYKVMLNKIYSWGTGEFKI